MISIFVSETIDLWISNYELLLVNLAVIFLQSLKNLSRITVCVFQSAMTLFSVSEIVLTFSLISLISCFSKTSRRCSISSKLSILARDTFCCSIMSTLALPSSGPSGFFSGNPPKLFASSVPSSPLLLFYIPS